MGLFSIFKPSNTLYFPGCLVYFKLKDNFEVCKKIFSKLGIGFRSISKQICCGLPALEAGYEQDARKLARRNFEIFKEEGIKEIITDSPCCYKMFLKDYPEILPDWNIETKNLWEIILNKLNGKPWLIKEQSNEEVTYHDSCYLGRHCGVYDAPRKIIEMLGYKIKEMPDSREKSICCGSCGGLMKIDEELADQIAKQRLFQAKRTGVEKIIVASWWDYILLKKNSDEIGIKVLHLCEVLRDALRIVKKEMLNLEINNEIEKKLEKENYRSRQDE